MANPTQGIGPYSSVDYQNGADIQGEETYASNPTGAAWLADVADRNAAKNPYSLTTYSPAATLPSPMLGDIGDQQVMSDAGNGYGDAFKLGAPAAAPSAADKAMLSALTRAMQKPFNGYGPRVMLDDLGNIAPDARPPLLSKENLQIIFPNAKAADLDNYLPALNKHLPGYGITTPERVSAFLGQVGVESGGFSTMSEDLYYKSPGRLQAVYGSKLFPTSDSETDYLRSPEGLANYVYANKGGNGPEDSGDGWSYRGSGLIQLTLKDNYLKVGRVLGLDLVGNPDQVRTDPDTAVKTALQYWQNKGLNQYADTGDYKTLTRLINAKSLHYDNRVAITQQALQVLRSLQKP